MASDNFGNSRGRNRPDLNRDLDNSEKLNTELQRIRQIADRMERERRRDALGRQMALNGVVRSTFAGMLFALIVMLTLHGFLRIFQGLFDMFF